MDHLGGERDGPVSRNGDHESSCLRRHRQSESVRSQFQPRGRAGSSRGKAKRGLDVLLALVMLVVFTPIIASIALWLRMVLRVPSFYSHERIGLHGRPFGCLKFTTMWPNSDQRLEEVLASDPQKRAEWEAKRKLSDDSRIIPGIGRFLRETSLDELPQLWNVLRGQMSVVGPRPVTAEELSFYGPFVQHYLSVRPGLTGPWQIGGRSDTTYDGRVKQDVWYVENGSLITDLKIFATTAILFVLGRLSGGR